VTPSTTCTSSTSLLHAANMADTQTVEAKELALVGKVEMRIALASSEKKLEDLLKIYLAPLLLKLGSEYVAVRNKVGIFHTSRLVPAISSSCPERR
jgi:hypothetical protein